MYHYIIIKYAINFTVFFSHNNGSIFNLKKCVHKLSPKIFFKCKFYIEMIYFLPDPILKLKTILSVIYVTLIFKSHTEDILSNYYVSLLNFKHFFTDIFLFAMFPIFVGERLIIIFLTMSQVKSLLHIRM